jgi:serine/threonine protein phosphatase PrpC
MKRLFLLIFVLVFTVLSGGQGIAYALSPDPDADPDEFAEHAEEFWAAASGIHEDETEQDDESGAAEPGIHEDETEQDEDPENANLFAKYWWAFAIGGGIIVIGGVTFFVYKKRKPVIVQAAATTITRTNNQYPVLLGNLHHIGARDNQQDSFCISDISNAGLCARKGILGVVADGMGGMADGAETSAIVTRTMLQYFNEVDSSDYPQFDMLVMLNTANENINRFMSGRDKGGSTVVAVIIHNCKLYWVAVGDSRIYLIRNGAIIQLNREHVYSVELDEKAAAGEISWETAAGDSRREALTSYLGIKDLEKIDRCYRPLNLLDGDRILLMSDGVFGVLTDEEILSTMPHPPQESAMMLQEMVLAKQNPNQDNFTAIIFEYCGNS